jgi:hypothetical protein
MKLGQLIAALVEAQDRISADAEVGIDDADTQSLMRVNDVRLCEHNNPAIGVFVLLGSEGYRNRNGPFAGSSDHSRTVDVIDEVQYDDYDEEH